MNNVTIFNHPLITHKIAIMRDERTGSKEFRELVEEVAMLMAFEALRDINTQEIEVKTPIAVTKTRVIANDIAIVPILRAGLGMVNGILAPCPHRKSRTRRSLSRPRKRLNPRSTTANFPTISQTAKSSFSIRCSQPAAAQSRQSTSLRQKAARTLSL